jgi:hypothetical protein
MMKRNVIVVALAISIFCGAVVSFAEETNSSQLKLSLAILQQRLLASQAQLANAPAAEDNGIQAINILGTYNGSAKGMDSTGNCITTPVKLVIEKQCGNFAKGKITALGVTVPVTGLFKNNILLSLDGLSSGSPAWFAGISAQYLGGNFMASSFYIQKSTPTTSNQYDSGWLLVKD